MKQTDKGELNANLKETRILETTETTKEYTVFAWWVIDLDVS